MYFMEIWRWWNKEKTSPIFVGNLYKKERLSWETLKSTLEIHEPPRVEGSL